MACQCERQSDVVVVVVREIVWPDKESESAILYRKRLTSGARAGDAKGAKASTNLYDNNNHSAFVYVWIPFCVRRPDSDRKRSY